MNETWQWNPAAVPELRDYLAAHAPAEIPDWFSHVEPPKDYPPAPRWMDAPKEHHELLRSWLNDGCFDLPDELRWFQDEMTAHRTGRDAWHKQNDAARYFQWRYAYADAMLAHRAAAK